MPPENRPFFQGNSSDRFGAKALARLAQAGDRDFEARRARGAVAARMFGLDAAPIRAGRYRLRERLGAGGMGIVYAADDPDLRRRVALKFMHPHLDDEQPGTQRRLLREARAAAKVVHPNVVQIYDVGICDGRVFVAMAKLGGGSLRDAIRGGTLRWQTTLRLFIEAGRGLAAAHRDGVVHGDFKPENVLIDDGGRPVVADFGLARGVGLTADPGLGRATPPTALGPHQGTTGHGGTPGYMAPDQLQGGRADAASDQFSFCVSLWEALHGCRPFKGATLDALITATTARQISGETTRVPRALRLLLLRGLSPRPSERFPNMDALLAAAERCLAPRRALAAGSLLGFAGLATAWVSERPADAPCHDAAASLAKVWDEPAHHNVAEAFAAAGGPFSDDAWASVERTLDAYADSWAAARGEACAMKAANASESTPLIDSRVRCLDRGAREMRALIELFQGADRDLVLLAPVAAQSLPLLDRCGEAQGRGAEARPHALDREAVEREQAELDVARAWSKAGDHVAAQAKLTEIADRARRIKHDPLLAAALFGLGQAHSLMGAYELAEAATTEAALLAEAGRVDAIAAEALIDLLTIVGAYRHRFDEARVVARRAQAAIDRLGNPEFYAAGLNNARGMVAVESGDLDGALRAFEQTVHQRRALFGPRHIETARALNNLGMVHYFRGELSEAREAITASLAAKTEVFGTAHPDVAGTMVNLGGILERQGDIDGAVSLELKALDALKAIDADHPVIGLALQSLTAAYQRRQDPERALLYARRSVAFHERNFGVDDPRTADALTNLGAALQEVGALDDAEAALERALDVYERRGLLKQRGVVALVNLGNVALDAGNNEAAVRRFAQCQPWLADTDSDLYDLRFQVEAGTGRALSALGRAAEAIAPLRRAVALDAQADAVEVAHVRFTLARALHREGDTDAGRRVAEAARDSLPAESPLRAELVEWIASQR